MYILILSYKKALSEVENHLDAHKNYLDKNYNLGNFIVSGRRNPRIGGIIFCRAENIEQVQVLIKEDPFYKYEIADYEIIEFEPTKYIEGFDLFL
ncbi:YciI family protein [Dysgonomonas macrotermitis]|uniref:Uncharacterized conserved protein YciI, contains a putative active-site phosphohistidine n=1 Tax=Dysgonomonas macrotermitis TaxID=1346286 RepID=A0A1M4Y1D1_9BACT|nr:YciI family protein [Dysgonomonas macrotermitis]SHE99634.1 Uncharacterized conserved protein YciI, contains a putative active-site phosphohistidine [Dysgonomonas macrotermitis]